MRKPLEHDPNLVPDDVTAAQIERAYDADPLPFPDTPDQDNPHDELGWGRFGAAVGLIDPTPARPFQALASARLADEQGTYFGVGMCLATQRSFWRVAALWPDAAAARAHAQPWHALTTGHAPRGSVGFALNGGHGHVWLNLGGGLVRTTDFHRPGRVDVALESRMLAWCGAVSHGWGEILNGVRVWPDAVKPDPTPAPHEWSPQRRAKFLAHEIAAAKEAGDKGKAEHLTLWRNRILERLDHHHGK